MVLRLTLSLCFTGVASSVNKESNSSEESSIITHCLTWRRGECVSCLSAACQNSPLCVCVCVRELVNAVSDFSLCVDTVSAGVQLSVQFFVCVCL